MRLKAFAVAALVSAGAALMSTQAHAAILTVSLSGLGSFKVDTSSGTATEVHGGLTVYEYNNISDLSIGSYTESNIDDRLLFSGGNLFKLGSSAPLQVGATPNLWMALIAGFRVLTIGEVTCTPCSFGGNTYREVNFAVFPIAPITGSFDVTITGDPVAAVPEPGTLALLGGGLLGLLGLRRRRQRMA
jgi:hypothetical protein